jgi:hypothetical protein
MHNLKINKQFECPNDRAPVYKVGTDVLGRQRKSNDFQQDESA